MECFWWTEWVRKRVPKSWSSCSKRVGRNSVLSLSGPCKESLSPWSKAVPGCAAVVQSARQPRSLCHYFPKGQRLRCVHNHSLANTELYSWVTTDRCIRVWTACSESLRGGKTAARNRITSTTSELRDRGTLALTVITHYTVTQIVYGKTPATRLLFSLRQTTREYVTRRLTKVHLL